MIKVITYGTYDLFHYGHQRLLERAKALGDYLIVGVTADDFDIRCAFFAEQPGQVVTDTEVVDYNKGDLILHFVNQNGVDYDSKVVVCTDLIAKDDISRWFKSLTKKIEVNETI